MISLSNVASAGGAMHYFSQDNYYTQEQGLQESGWFGRGAEILGLTGKVEKEQFAEILKGHVGGQELGKLVNNEKTGVPERDHRPGTDMTFSAPKSVSLLAEVGGRQDARQAHEAAVTKALAYIESELAGTRQTTGAVTQNVRTGNLSVAMFRHNTSRDLDPQTHTHAVILNVTLRDDGHWRSLDNTPIFEDKALISAIYTAELAKGLQELGFELTRTDDKGNFEITGITRDQIEHFSQRRAEIEAALSSRGIAIDSATREEREAATLMTRGRKTQVDHDQLITGWKDQAQALGIDFTEINARAQEHRDKGGFVPQNLLSGREAMVFSGGHHFEREAVVEKSQLMATAMAHGAGRVGPDKVMQAFDTLERDGDLVKLPDGRYTSQKMISSEIWSLEQVRAHKGQTAPVMTVQQVIQRIADDEVRRNTESGQRNPTKKFVYTDGQKDALILALTTKDRYMEVQGLAGTGKTTMLKALNAMAQEHGVVVRGMAPTGAASQTLSREAGIPSDTVSMFFVKERKLQDDIAFARRYADDFKRKDEMWVVDESSFLSQKQKSLIDALAQTAGAKVVYLGDKLQLQGVEAGKPFELAQNNGISTAYMTEISRQKTPQMKHAVAIMTGHDQLAPGERLNEIELASNARAFNYMDSAGMVREVRESDANLNASSMGGGELVQAVVADVLRMNPVERANTLVITPFNKDRHEINAGIRAGLRLAGELQGTDQKREVFVRPDSGGKTRAEIKEAQYYKVGDVVRSGKTYKTIDLAKGEYTRVAAVHSQQGRVVLQKDNGQLVDWYPMKANMVEVYQSEQRDIAKGDLIRLTRNEGELTNGTIARIVRIEGSEASLEVSRSNAVEMHQIDLTKNRHWDHAYASTVHASQGSTQQQVVFLIRTPETSNDHQQDQALQQMAKVFADRSFYVGVTRASHETRIYTNNKEVAAQAVGIKQDKTSAVETIDKYADVLVHRDKPRDLEPLTR